MFCVVVGGAGREPQRAADFPLVGVFETGTTEFGIQRTIVGNSPMTSLSCCLDFCLTDKSTYDRNNTKLRTEIL